MTATLPRPGASVQLSNAPFPSTPPTFTGPWFVAGLAEKGPLKAVKVESLSQFVEKFGVRVSWSVLYDALDEYFSDGGAAAYVGRVVGPAAATASAILTDGSAGEALKVLARGPGEYANTYKIKVTNTGGTEFKIEIFNGAILLEVSPQFTSDSAAVSWSQINPYIEVVLGASGLLPKTQEVTLATGKDDRVNITDAQWRNGLKLFTRSLGPGQVTQIGRTTSTAYNDTLIHAAENNRFAILDGPQSATVTTVTSAAVGQRGGEKEKEIYGFLWAPWITIPGVLPGTTRFVPPSAFIAAKVASSDGEGNSPNKAAANLLGKSKRAIGLEQLPYDNGEGPDITRDEMYSKGVNLIVEEEGSIQAYGWRSLADPNGPLQDWVDAGNCRLRMAIVAKANAIAKSFVLDEIDGAGKTFKEFEAQLKAMLGQYWRKGSLYGATAEEAFSVNVGPTINTPASIQNKEMKAAISLRMSENSEMVVIVIAKVPVSQQIP